MYTHNNELAYARRMELIRVGAIAGAHMRNLYRIEQETFGDAPQWAIRRADGSLIARRDTKADADAHAARHYNRQLLGE